MCSDSRKQKIMKTICSVLFILMISLSVVKGQSLTPTPQRGEMISKMNLQKKGSDQSNSTVYLLDSLTYKDNTGIYQSKYEYLYNNKGLQTSYINYTTWDATNNKWKGGSKTVSTYDSIGHRTLYIYYTWDATNNSWKMYSKYEFTFDRNGYLIFNSSFKWDATNSKWINWNKAENTNDSIGHKIHYLTYLWDNTKTVWNMTNKSEYTFDRNGLQTLMVSYTYTTNIWKESSKSEYTYDSSGHRTLYVAYTWDATNNTWKRNSKTEYSYESKGLQTSYVTYTWDATNNTWKGSSKTEYTYNNDGLQTLSVLYKWDATNNIWNESSKTESTYDSNGNITQSIYWVYTSNVWVRNQIGNYYYSTLVISEVTNPAIARINIYPNPAKSEIRIAGLKEQSGFTLYDMTGKLVMSKYIQNNESISINSLPKSMYIVRIITHEGNIVSKIIKD